MASGVALLFGFAVVSTTLAEDQSVDDIVSRSNKIDKIPSWSADLTITLRSKDNTQRVRESRIYSTLDDNSEDAKRLVRLISPADIGGTNVLIHEHSGSDDDIWIYLPSMKKVRRLVSGSRKDSFVGTDFSYADIVTPKQQDYRYRLIGREKIGNYQCFVVEAIPKTEFIAAGVGYSRYIAWIRMDNFVRAKAEFFDLAGEHYKVLQVHSATEVAGFPGKWLVEKMEMNNLQSGHSTMLEFNGIKVGQRLDNMLFAPSRLDRK